MKKYSIHILLSALMLTLTLSACTEFLDVSPSDKQTADQLFASKNGFYTASNGIYDALSSDALYGKNMSWYALDLMAYHYMPTQKTQEIQQLVAGNYTSPYVSPIVSSMWSDSYATIMAANLLIDRVNAQTGILSEQEAGCLIGEMLGVRAYLHLDMLRLFGPSPMYADNAPSIPYNESSNVTALPLLPFNEVIEKIIADLDRAQALLEKYDPIVTEGPLATEAEDGSSLNLRYRQYRMNYYAVKALKARAYLWGGDTENALAAALAVINDPKVNEYFPAVDPNNILANTTNPDRVFSSETLFGIYDKDRNEVFTDNFATASASSIMLLQPYSDYITNGSGLFTLPLAGDRPETSDYRYQCQWEQSSGTGNSGFQFIKYKKISQPDPLDEDSEYFYAHMISLMRISELYLIAAECDPVNGFDYYCKERARRGVQLSEDDTFMVSMYYSDYGYAGIFLQNEYCREFWGEGQMFYCLKRLPMIPDPGYENCVYYNMNGSQMDMNYIVPVLPLPEGEMK